MAHLVARMTGLVTAWALVVACSPGAVDPGAEGASANSDSRSRAWPGNSAVVVGERPCVWWDRPTPRDLSPTGIELLVAPGSDTRKRRSNLAVEGMAVDGTGAVWIHSPWRLFRIDPDTGDASTWDIGDDLAFGTVSSIRPSVSAGVWLLYEDRVALFDGLRFVRELIVPGAYRLDKPIRSFVEFGSEAWVASPAGVARYDSGLWSMVGDDRLRSAASLTIGPPGQVWASGRLGVVNGTPRGVVRFDGQTWQQVGGPVPMVPQEEIIANVGEDLIYVIGNGVYRSAGTEWQTLGWDNTGWGAVRSLAVTEDGHVWLQREGGVARWEASSGWTAVGPASAGWDDLTIQALAADGNEVFVAGGRGLFRVDGDELTHVWAPVRIGPRTDWHPQVDEGINSDARREPSFGLLRAVSSDEVWLASGSSLFRYHRGRWESEWRMGPAWNSIPWSLPLEARSAKMTVATDGSVWTSTQRGMVRFVEGQRQIVDEGPAHGLTSAGPDGAVWVVEPGTAVRGATIREPGDDITLVGPEGRRGSVPLPNGANAVTSVHSSAAGRLFLTMRPLSDHDEPSPYRELLRWDGGWTHLPYPGEDLVYLAADPGGGLWAAVTPVGAPEADPIVARYAQGDWSLFPEATGLSSLTLGPGGSVCGMAEVGLCLVCVDPAGHVSREPLGVSGGLSIGTDRSVWLTYEGMLARLPVTAPF